MFDKVLQSGEQMCPYYNKRCSSPGFKMYNVTQELANIILPIPSKETLSLQTPPALCNLTIDL